MHIHVTEVCRHGIIVRNCRCASNNKRRIVVPCPEACTSIEKRGMSADKVTLLERNLSRKASEHVKQGILALDSAVRSAVEKGEGYLERWAGCQWVVSLTTEEGAEAVANVAKLQLEQAGPPPAGFTLMVKLITPLSVMIELIYDHAACVEDWKNE